MNTTVLSEKFEIKRCERCYSCKGKKIRLEATKKMNENVNSAIEIYCETLQILIDLSGYTRIPRCSDDEPDTLSLTRSIYTMFPDKQLLEHENMMKMEKSLEKIKDTCLTLRILYFVYLQYFVDVDGLQIKNDRQ